MADVFISFSHKDEEFVRRLFDVLQEREVDAWVDWQDIPPSTYFNGEILPAIDAALAMVIVISPGYLKSQVCRWELDHALRNQKRLITVLAATTEPSLLPPPLGEIHWISFVDDVGLQDDGNVERLVNVIRSDFAWIRNHSRILVRAREWSEKNRHRSFLLYGQDLSEAEHWLATKHNGREQATDIHREYIRCSRVWAAWRKRATVVVAAFVIVCLPIMYFGYSLYKSRQRQILAQDLGLEAAMLLPQEDGARRALLLAAESLKMYPTLEANAAILNAISVSPIQLMSLPGSRQPCALSEDGEVLATVGQDGEVNLSHISSRVKFGIISRKNIGATQALTLSGDGRRLAVLNHNGLVTVWDTASLTPLARWTFESEPVEMALDASGNMLIVRDSEQRVHVWDLTASSASGPDRTPLSNVSLVSLRPDSHQLAVVQNSTVILWDIDTSKAIREFSHDAPVVSISFSADGNRMLTRTSTNSLRSWNVELGRMLTFLEKFPESKAVILAYDADRFFSVGNDLQACSLYDGRQIARATFGVSKYAFDEPGMPIRLVSSIGNVCAQSTKGHRIVIEKDFEWQVWELPSVDRQGILQITNQPCGKAVLSHDGKLLAITVASKDVDKSLVRVVALANANSHVDFTCQGLATTVAFSRDARQLAIGLGSGRVTIWDLATQVELCHLDQDWLVADMAFDATGRQLMTATADRQLKVWDIASQKVLSSLRHSGRYQLIKSAHLSEHIVALDDYVARLFHWPSGQQVGEYRSPNFDLPGELVAGAISGLGNRVAIADRSNLVTVLNTASGSRELSIVQEFPIRELALDEDGVLLAIGDNQSQIHFWNVALGRRIAVRDLALESRFENSLLTDMAFQPETQDLICTSLQGAFRLESVLPDDLLRRAEAHVTTNWSAALWQRYFSSSPFDPAFKALLTEEEQLTKARIK